MSAVVYNIAAIFIGYKTFGWADADHTAHHNTFRTSHEITDRQRRGGLIISERSISKRTIAI